MSSRPRIPNAAETGSARDPRASSAPKVFSDLGESLCHAFDSSRREPVIDREFAKLLERIR